jgi:hypothetical protein
LKFCTQALVNAVLEKTSYSPFNAQIHLYNSWIVGLCDALTLLITIAFDILWVGISVLATVIWVAFQPSLLCPILVVLVVRVVL